MSILIAEYQAALHACATIAKLLQYHDLPALLDAVSTAETVGPLMDPTLWRRQHQAMAEDKALLEAALPLWRWGKEAGG